MQPDISLAMGLKLSAGHAIYFRDENALAIADLHLGYEATLQAEHVSIPRFQLEPMLERLSQLMNRYQPEQVMINGDLKHDFSHNKGQEWDEVEAVLGALRGVDVSVIRGNHDNYLQAILAPRGIQMEDSCMLADGNIKLSHGHKISDAGNGFRVFAHEHPVIRMKDEVGARLTLPCFVLDLENDFLLMPAFSPLASGIDALSPESGFMNPALRKLDMSEARIYAIHEGVTDFGRVGDLRDVREELVSGTVKFKNRAEESGGSYAGKI